MRCVWGRCNCSLCTAGERTSSTGAGSATSATCACKCWEEACCITEYTVYVSDAAETDVCVQKCQVAAASRIMEMRSYSETTSLCHLWWDGASQLLGPPGHQTSHQLTSSYGTTLKPWFTHCELIVKRILTPVLLKQQQPGTFESHVSLCCVVSCVSSSVAVHLNICSKLVWNTNSLQNT